VDIKQGVDQLSLAGGLFSPKQSPGVIAWLGLFGLGQDRVD
jgi:hypothetical protein